MADKDSSSKTDILHAAGSGEEHPPPSVPGASYLNDGQSADIRLAIAPYTTQSMNSAEALSTTTSDNSAEHQADAGALHVARPAHLELVARQNRGSNRGTSDPYCSDRGRGRQSRQNSASSTATIELGQQRPSSYSRGGNNAMPGSMGTRGGQRGKTSMPTVSRQMFIADSGRFSSAMGKCVNFRSGNLNTVARNYAVENGIDLGGAKSNRAVLSRAEENVIDLRESQSSNLDLIDGVDNLVNLTSAQDNTITLRSRSDIACGQRNQIFSQRSSGLLRTPTDEETKAATDFLVEYLRVDDERRKGIDTTQQAISTGRISPSAQTEHQVPTPSRYRRPSRRNQVARLRRRMRSLEKQIPCCMVCGCSKKQCPCQMMTTGCGHLICIQCSRQARQHHFKNCPVCNHRNALYVLRKVFI